jgi:hypothetical protein
MVLFASVGRIYVEVFSSHETEAHLLGVNLCLGRRGLYRITIGVLVLTVTLGWLPTEAPPVPRLEPRGTRP